MTGSNVTTGKMGSSQHSPKQKLEACGFAVMLLSFSEERSIKLEMKRSGYVLHGMYACIGASLGSRAKQCSGSEVPSSKILQAKLRGPPSCMVLPRLTVIIQCIIRVVSSRMLQTLVRVADIWFRGQTHAHGYRYMYLSSIHKVPKVAPR